MEINGIKTKKAKKQAVINNPTVNILSEGELARRIAVIQEGMEAFDLAGTGNKRKIYKER